MLRPHPKLRYESLGISPGGQSSAGYLSSHAIKPPSHKHRLLQWLQTTANIRHSEVALWPRSIN
jgi:hypothetical protein